MLRVTLVILRFVRQCLLVVLLLLPLHEELKEDLLQFVYLILAFEPWRFLRLVIRGRWWFVLSTFRSLTLGGEQLVVFIFVSVVVVDWKCRGHFRDRCFSSIHRLVFCFSSFLLGSLAGLFEFIRCSVSRARVMQWKTSLVVLILLIDFGEVVVSFYLVYQLFLWVLVSFLLQLGREQL